MSKKHDHIRSLAPDNPAVLSRYVAGAAARLAKANNQDPVLQVRFLKEICGYTDEAIKNAIARFCEED